MSLVGDPYDLGRRDSDKPSGLMKYVGSNDHNDSHTRMSLRHFGLMTIPFWC
jgi:hypothetical protein